MKAKLYYLGRSHTSHYAQADDGNLYWWKEAKRFSKGHWRKSHHSSIAAVARCVGVHHKPKLIGIVTMTGEIRKGEM